MLVGLSIRDLLLIDRLDIEFGGALTVLTGETGAGKSILLDALGLATGARGDSGFVRSGCQQLSVTAEFALDIDHPVWPLLEEQGMVAGEDQDAVGRLALLLRRVVTLEGRSRAFINDQPVSIATLRAIGAMLVEVHGQQDSHGLLNPASHRALLDSFAGLGADLRNCQAAYEKLAAATAAVTTAQDALTAARAEEAYLRHLVDELDALSPEIGEEDTLARERALMMNAEKLAGDMQGALADISGTSAGGDIGADGLLASALRRLERIAAQAGGKLDPAIEALDRACSEAIEGRALLEEACRSLEFEPQKLEKVEARLFDLRAMARKHKVAVDKLPELYESAIAQLSRLDHGVGELERLHAEVEAASAAYRDAALTLSKKRQAAAIKLDTLVAAELAPLKLDKACFTTRVTNAKDQQPRAHGLDDVAFQVATNPGAPAGPLSKIASGGELSRFMLALRVVLSKASTVTTLIFDEIDAAVGGATADAIGDRLSRLADGVQILAVTHSPQVAARGLGHFHVAKFQRTDETITAVRKLAPEERREEIARMLAGAEITDAARVAADSLLTLAQ